MVVEVVYRHDETLLSLSRNDETEEQSTSVLSYQVYDMGRDTSHTHRECADDTRQSLQTNRSILNCTTDSEAEDDEDDEDVEARSFLFADEDFHSPLNQSLMEDSLPAADEGPVLVMCSPATPANACCAAPVETKNDWLDTSLQNVTDSFVSLCSSRPDDACAGFASTVVNATNDYSRELQRQVQLDLLHLLASPDVVWIAPLLASDDTATAKGAPVRRTPRQRAERIQRMCKELDGHFHSQAEPLAPARSMQHTGLEHWIGKGMEPIGTEQDDGYDSDPGRVFRKVPQSLIEADHNVKDKPANQEDYHFYDGHRERVAQEFSQVFNETEPRDEYDYEIYQAVQESLNHTWALTWHVQGNPIPICIHLWIERGTLLHEGSVVVEPKFVWRESHSATTRKPMDVRVLNACRIVESSDSIDRNIYPMARASCSFCLKTCRDETFLFEAASPTDRAEIVHRWKLVVARLASLAVMEDMDRMAKEFFTSTMS